MTKANTIKRFIATKIIFLSLMGTAAIDSYKTTERPASYNASPTLNQIVKSEPTSKYSFPTQEELIQQIEPTKEAKERLESWKVATCFPIWYKTGDLGYAESVDAYDIPIDWVMSHTVKEGDTIDKYWEMEGQEPTLKDLKQRIILTINLPALYPKGFPKKFNLSQDDIILPKGKKINFADLNHDGRVFGEPGEYVPLEDALKITGLKDNYGELIRNGTNRR
jgi:hypothetical protein